MAGDDEGQPGESGKKVQLSEPAGLCLSHDGALLYIVDTNNHCVKVHDFHSGFTTKVHVLSIGKTNPKYIVLYDWIADLAISTRLKELSMLLNLMHYYIITLYVQ